MVSSGSRGLLLVERQQRLGDQRGLVLTLDLHRAGVLHEILSRPDLIHAEQHRGAGAPAPDADGREERTWSMPRLYAPCVLSVRIRLDRMKDEMSEIARQPRAMLVRRRGCTGST
jgi:hypothetical protein